MELKYFGNRNLLELKQGLAHQVVIRPYKGTDVLILGVNFNLLDYKIKTKS